MKVNFSRQFQHIVDKHGDRPAIVNVERDRRLSYRELHLLSNKVTNLLRTKFDLQTLDRYLFILDNDNMSLFHFSTIFKGDMTAAFSNYRDSLEEHAWQLSYAKPKVVFIENALIDSHFDMLRANGAEVVCMDALEEPREGLYSFWDLIEDVSDENPDIEIDDREHPVLIRFTGGTTGQGKPAVYCADNWFGLRDTAYALEDSCWGSDSRTLHLAPITHGSGMFFVPTFFAGGCNFTMNEPDLVRYCQTIESENITHAFLVPTILYRLLEIPEVSGMDLSSMQNMFYGAAPMSPAKLKLLQERFGNIFIQVYGSTEHFNFALSLSKSDHQTDESTQGRLAAAGRVPPGIEVIVADDEGNALPAGETGEFWLRSRGVCLGYLHLPEKTAEEFTDGYWRSGDVGYFDDEGYAYIVDRKKDMIITGGFNVYAIEVEAAVNAHEAVMMSAVIGRPHEDWGEAVHAEVILREGMSVDESELIEFVKEALGRYKAPKTIAFVNELPLSVVGKVLRKDVRKKYWEGTARGVA